MGLGKFNYLNRKSEGPKLGAIVAKDLRKRASTITKDAKGAPIVLLEICLANKSLTDAGLFQVVSGLLDAITLTRNAETSLVLEELSLTGNKLTVKSLRALVPVIKMSDMHLKDVDLSSNEISLKNKEDADDWETFLAAFAHCGVMRRMVLSNNDLSNGMGFEIFARIHAQHAGRIESVNVDSPDTSSSKHLLPIETRQNTDDELQIVKRSKGLCSIPYIILSNVNMNEPGALWFSYILESHGLPDQLMTSPVKAGPVAVALEEYGTKTKCQGLVYRPNEALSPLGWKILNTAEQARKRKFKAASAFAPESADEENDEIEDPQVPLTRLSRSRCSSAIPLVDLQSLRRKFQRNAIETGQRTQLWKAGLKTVVLSRILLSSQTPCREQNGSDVLPLQTLLMSGQHENAYVNPNNGKVPITRPSFSSVLMRAQSENHPPSRNRLLLSFEPLMRPRVSVIMKRTECVPITRTLPVKVLSLVISHAAGSFGVLGHGQRKRAEDFGMRGAETLKMVQQKDWKSKGESHQIWHVLEAIGCLEYEMGS